MGRNRFYVGFVGFGMCVLLTLAVADGADGQAPTRPAASAASRPWKASELIGLNVRSAGDEEKGEIKDLLIAPDGHVEYAAVAFGGFLGIGDKLFAVPLEAIHIEWKDNKVSHAKVDVTEESIKQRQGFDQDHWPEHADRGFVGNAVPKR